MKKRKGICAENQQQCNGQLSKRTLLLVFSADKLQIAVLQLGPEVLVDGEGDGLAGRHLGGSRIPQGHPNGYPLYRLEWQAVGSLNRRIRNCLTGVRAEPFPPDAPELTALALFLAWRADGLLVETPAVRP